MVNVGIIGCGAISGIYLQSPKTFPILNIVACADLDPAKAQAKADEHGLRALAVEELLRDPEIEIVLNLTIPGAHAQVGLAAVGNGKSVYSEKPLALSTAEATPLLEQATRAGLRVGCAPDTFLGGGLQTCRQLIDAGAIGEPVAATAFMMSHGHEHWHPSPEFYYKPGGGPMFDMGPYYLTALVHLLGPVRRVTGATRTTFAQRTISSEPLAGAVIDVEVPTHVVGLLDFAAGPVATIITTFDVWTSDLPRIEIYGTEGTMSVPDPNTFGGPVRIRRHREAEWIDVPLRFPYTTNSRGLGLADMAHALVDGRVHRASGELAFHVLEIMEAIHRASDDDRHIQLASTCSRPAPLIPDAAPGILAA
ncbi:MAG: Gfo/Idh/MocA family oxidoreductase [Litorilinea sp.]